VGFQKIGRFEQMYTQKIYWSNGLMDIARPCSLRRHNRGWKRRSRLPNDNLCCLPDNTLGCGGGEARHGRHGRLLSADHAPKLCSCHAV
jgi:hypothetical protein